MNTIVANFIKGDASSIPAAGIEYISIKKYGFIKAKHYNYNSSLIKLKSFFT
jgi:hypothetical protein